MIWITGNTGAGKTTLAKAIQKEYPNTIILDGDDMREVWAQREQLNYSRQDRWDNNMIIGRLAQILERQGFDVVVSSICPYRMLRNKLTLEYNPEWIQLLGGKESCEEYPYEY